MFHSGHMSDLRARFAAELRVARQAAGMTQEDLAEATGTSVDFLSKLERGLNSPSLETLAAIVKALSLDPARILQAELDDRLLAADRLELETRAAHLMRDLDDRTLEALLEIMQTLKRLRDKPTGGSKSPRRK